MSPTLTTFLFEAANFLVLAAALGWLFFNPVRNALRSRREKLLADQRLASDTLQKAETLKREIDDLRANLQAELNQQRKSELEAAQRQASEIVAEARAAAARQREQSHRLATQISDAQRDTLAEVSAAVAAEAVGRLLQQIDGPELQSALLRSACEQLESFSTEAMLPVKVESAKPLPAEQLRMLKDTLGLAANGAEFRTVEGLGPGVRISTAMGLIDATTNGLAQFASIADQRTAPTGQQPQSAAECQ